ncbi:hypothetical protein Ddc_07101 [Ditylenchus destructor]|nr:hypothetical protein Ddc_07101 [Ditylenchus destructor]
MFHTQKTNVVSLWVTRLRWSFVAGIKRQAVPGISTDSRSSTDRCWPLPVLAHLNQSRDLDTTAVTMTELHPNRLPICLQIHTSAQVSHNKTFQLMQKLSINHNKEAYFGEFRELKVTILPSLKDQSQLLAVESKAR